jgi:hypothetical protein
MGQAAESFCDILDRKVGGWVRGFVYGSPEGSLRYCSPGVHGRRIWWRSGGRKSSRALEEKKEKEIKALQKNLLELRFALKSLAGAEG